MKSSWRIIATLFVTLSLFACGEDDGMDPENLLDQVGFEGTLPGGQPVDFPSLYQAGSEPIAYSFKTDEDGEGKIYEGNVITHILSLKDLDRGFSIFIRLPELKWSEVATTDFSSKKVYEEIYSFDRVKEVLALGEKKIGVLDFGYNREDFGSVPDFFQVQFVPDGNLNTILSGIYNPFFHEGNFEMPTDNFLRVTRQTEGTYLNEKGEQKRLLLVEMELKLQMYENKSEEGNIPLHPLQGRLAVIFKEFVPEHAK